MTRGTNVAGMKRDYRTARNDTHPGMLPVRFDLVSNLRYGENPNQPGALYRPSVLGPQQRVTLNDRKEGKGGTSATNIMDICRAVGILSHFSKPSVAVMKHNIPSGFATQVDDGQTLESLYIAARDADARSAFGSVVVTNRPIDKATAQAIAGSYVEVVAAPDLESGVMRTFNAKKNLRVVTFSGEASTDYHDIKVLPTGHAVIQRPYESSIKGPEDLVLDAMIEDDNGSHIVARDPTPRELQDMLTAWYVNLGVRSNGIVFVREGVTLAIGSGQQERVGAVEQAIIRAYQKEMDRRGEEYDPLEGIFHAQGLGIRALEGAVCSSDGFFPFKDSIDTLARVGVTGVIQPGGSVRDAEVIDAVNEYNMSMAYTLERCFGHF